jgi:hypothetical protein
MKEYKKLIKELRKTKLFSIIKTTRKTTVKLVHNKSGELYSIHPGDNAVNPLRKWAEKFIK